MREFCSINQFQMRTRGRGSKNPKILWTSLMDAPLRERPLKVKVVSKSAARSGMLRQKCENRAPMGENIDMGRYRTHSAASGVGRQSHM